MSENKHTEWKESWGDEHFKVICAFTNAQGRNIIGYMR